MTLTIAYDTGALHMTTHDDIGSCWDALKARFTAHRIDGYAMAGVVMFDAVRDGRIVPRRVATYRIAV